MSVVIIGGNECMERQYKDVCKEYNCKTKVYSKKNGSVKGFGNPDLLILFTNTVSHKMVRTALNNTGESTKIERIHSSSIAALRTVLEENINK